jgi:hypothetical protein
MIKHEPRFGARQCTRRSDLAPDHVQVLTTVLSSSFYFVTSARSILHHDLGKAALSGEGVEMTGLFLLYSIHMKSKLLIHMSDDRDSAGHLTPTINYRVGLLMHAYIYVC